MGIESLYADDIEAGIQRQLANPGPGPGTSFSTRSFISAGMKGLPAAGLQVGGSALDLLAPAADEVARRPRLKILENQPDDRERVEATAKFVTDGGEIMRTEAATYAPDPATAHIADQVLYGLTRVGSKVVAATAVAPLAGAAALLGAEGTNTAYHELIAKGIDPATALKAGAIEGIGQAAAVIPMAGSTIKATAALSVAAGPGTFMAQEALSRKILQQAGYNDEASRHDPLDPLGLTIATLLPAVFGGGHAVGLARAAKARPTLADVVLGNESGGKRYAADGSLLTSPKGAQGEMQLMPKTATDPGYGVTPAKDNSPDELARVGRDYLAAMEHRYGSPDIAMAAYNAGPGAVDKALLHGADWLSHLPDETQKYVEKGMKKLGDRTVEHAATDPEAVDAARVRTTQDALHRSMPKAVEAPADVMRAADAIAAGEMPNVRPLTDYSDFFADMVPKFDVPPESRASIRTDELGMPEIRTAGIMLTDAHPTERMEHIPGGDGVLTRFAVRDASGNVMGHADLLLQDGKVVSLYDIETTPGLRGQGIGAKVVEAITALDPDRKIEISNIVDDAVPFWEKVGVQVSDGNRSPTLDWHQFAESPAGRSRGATRRSEAVAENAQAHEPGAAGRDGSTPQGGDARELTPEEAAQFGFPDGTPNPRSEGTNTLPPTGRVTLEPEVAAKAPEPTKLTARVAQIAEENPGMPVQLPGSDRTVTVAEAMRQAKEQHALEASESDLVKAALDCALGFGA